MSNYKLNKLTYQELFKQDREIQQQLRNQNAEIERRRNHIRKDWAILKANIPPFSLIDLQSCDCTGIYEVISELIMKEGYICVIFQIIEIANSFPGNYTFHFNDGCGYSNISKIYDHQTVTVYNNCVIPGTNIRPHITLHSKKDLQTYIITIIPTASQTTVETYLNYIWDNNPYFS